MVLSRGNKADRHTCRRSVRPRIILAAKPILYGKPICFLLRAVVWLGIRIANYLHAEQGRPDSIQNILLLCCVPCIACKVIGSHLGTGCESNAGTIRGSVPFFEDIAGAREPNTRFTIIRSDSEGFVHEHALFRGGGAVPRLAAIAIIDDHGSTVLFGRELSFESDVSDDGCVSLIVGYGHFLKEVRIVDRDHVASVICMFRPGAILVQQDPMIESIPAVVIYGLIFYREMYGAIFEDISGIVHRDLGLKGPVGPVHEICFPDLVQHIYAVLRHIQPPFGLQLQDVFNIFMLAVVVAIDVVDPIRVIRRLIIGIYAGDAAVHLGFEVPTMVSDHRVPTDQSVSGADSCRLADVCVADLLVVVDTEHQRLIVGEGVLALRGIGIQHHAAALGLPFGIDRNVRITHDLMCEIEGNVARFILEPAYKGIAVQTVGRNIGVIVLTTLAVLAQAGTIIKILRSLLGSPGNFVAF